MPPDQLKVLINTPDVALYTARQAEQIGVGKNTANLHNTELQNRKRLNNSVTHEVVKEQGVGSATYDAFAIWIKQKNAFKISPASASAEADKYVKRRGAS